MEEMQRQRIRDYLDLRAHQTLGVGDPMDTYNRLCRFYTDDSSIGTTDGQDYDGIDDVARYLKRKQVAVPVNSYITKDRYDEDVFHFTLANNLFKAVTVTIRFHSEFCLKFLRVDIREASFTDAISATLSRWSRLGKR